MSSYIGVSCTRVLVQLQIQVERASELGFLVPRLPAHCSLLKPSGLPKAGDGAALFSTEKEHLAQGARQLREGGHGQELALVAFLAV